MRGTGRARAYARRAVAAMEFTMIAPIMALVLLAVFDIGKGMILKQQVFNAAHAIAVAASIQAVQLDKSTSLTPTAAQTSMSAIWAEMPWFRSGIANGYTVVTLTSIAFTNSSASCNPANATCTYIPNVAWTAYYLGGVANGATHAGPLAAGNVRPCGPQSAVGPDYPIDPNHEFYQLKTLNVNNPDPVVVADVVYIYVPYLPPLVSKMFPGSFPFESTVMWPVRSVSTTSGVPAYTTYNLSNLPDGGAGTKCSGYD